MIKKQIQNYARQLGFDGCRFTTASSPDHADSLLQWLGSGNHGQMEYLARNSAKRVDPQLVLPGAKTIITLATSYHHETEKGLESSLTGKTARYSHFPDYHDVLAGPLKALSDFLSQIGGSETRSLWYVDTGPLLERDLAQRSGLGFIGKHTNLISRELGNWFFLSEIITTLVIEPDEAEKNRCGTCSRCMQACPTGAITGSFQLDARRCISYLTIELKGSIPVEFRRAMGTRIYGCDDCLAACPWNRFAREGSLMPKADLGDWTAPDLLKLLELDDVGFKKRFAGMPILRAKRRGLLRNVCVALGNVGDVRVLPALEKMAVDPEPLIAEHAQWAISEVKSRLSMP